MRLAACPKYLKEFKDLLKITKDQERKK